jgi:glycine/serine hydroxymethyltransferase
MGKAEMKRVAQLIDQVLTTPDEATVVRVKGEVGELTRSFPLYRARRA